MKKNVKILIPDADSPLSVKVATCLAISGYENIHGIIIVKNHRMKYSRDCTYHFVETNSYYSNEFFNFVVDVIKKNKIDLIMPVLQRGIIFCNNHRSKLSQIANIGLMPNLVQLDKVNFKDNLSKYLSENKFPIPKTIIVSEIEDFEKAFKNTSFPVLLKPIERAGGSGISRCDNIEILLKKLDELEKSQYGNFIIQEFIDGEDAGFSCLCKDGEIIAYTIHRAVLPPYKLYQIPLSIQFFKDEMILDCMSKLVKSLKWTGVFDLDMILVKDSHKIIIIEINPRFWASIYASLNAGINFADLYVKISTGDKVNKLDYNDSKFIRLKMGMLKHLLFYLRNFKLKETDLKYLIHDIGPELAVKFLRAS